jgi:hypothetical protein
MRLVAVATHAERYFPLLLASCRRFGTELHVLCWKEPWRGYAQKLTAMLDYLTTLPEDEVVCMIDAFDTFLLQPPDVLEERFRRTGAKMIIAADGSPPNGVVRFFVHRIFPPVDGIFTNSGTYIAYAGHLRRLLKQVMSAGYTSQNDQEMLARFCSTHDGWLTVDTRSEFFLTFYAGSRWTLTNELSTSLDRAGVEIVNGDDDKPVLRWRPTGTFPAILHAPCDGNVNAILERLGYELPPSVLNYSSGDHAAYLWRATRAYLPLIWDGLLLIALVVVLAILTLYLIVRFLIRRLAPSSHALSAPPPPPPLSMSLPQVSLPSGMPFGAAPPPGGAFWITPPPGVWLGPAMPPFDAAPLGSALPPFDAAPLGSALPPFDAAALGSALPPFDAAAFGVGGARPLCPFPVRIGTT